MRRVIAVVIALIGASCLAPVPAGAQSTSVFEHWGAFAPSTSNAPSDQLDSPTAVTVPDPNPIVEVGSSNAADYALTSDGKVWAIGDGTEGELGDGNTVNDYTNPVQVQFPSGVVIASLATDVSPFNTAIAISTTGVPYGWGYDNLGELCLGNTDMQLTAVALPIPGGTVTSVAGGADHASYLGTDGTVWSCGSNQHGNLGDGSTNPSTTPVAVVGLPSNVVSIFGSYGNEGALTSNGSYYDWGFGRLGNLGDGTTRDAYTPVLVHLPARVAQVALGGSDTSNGQTLVVLSDGRMESWGANSYGQLGYGYASSAQTTPAPFASGSGGAYVAIASGGQTSYGVDRDGAVYSWGNGANGEVGNGGTPKRQLNPVRTIDGGIAQVSATARGVVAGPTVRRLETRR